MNHSLRVALCRSATARAHLAGAEAAELDARAVLSSAWAPFHLTNQMLHQSAAARRRYWREVAAVQLLMGDPWPGAEALGVEP